MASWGMDLMAPMQADQEMARQSQAMQQSAQKFPLEMQEKQSAVQAHQAQQKHWEMQTQQIMQGLEAGKTLSGVNMDALKDKPASEQFLSMYKHLLSKGQIGPAATELLRASERSEALENQALRMKAFGDAQQANTALKKTEIIGRGKDFVKDAASWDQWKAVYKQGFPNDTTYDNIPWSPTVPALLGAIGEKSGDRVKEAIAARAEQGRKTRASLHDSRSAAGQDIARARVNLLTKHEENLVKSRGLKGVRKEDELRATRWLQGMPEFKDYPPEDLRRAGGMLAEGVAQITSAHPGKDPEFARTEVLERMRDQFKAGKKNTFTKDEPGSFDTTPKKPVTTDKPPSGFAAGSKLVGHTPEGKGVWQAPNGKKFAED